MQECHVDTGAAVNATTTTIYNDKAIKGSSDEVDEYRAYFRRHLVLLSWALTIAAWNLSALRATSVVPSYARYHNATNEVSAPPVWGIDMFTLASNVVAIFTFLPASYCIDRFGLRCVKLGSLCLAISAWIWYAVGRSITGVILSVVFAAFAGPLVSTSLLAISNRWYPPHERAKATAFGTLVALIGAGLAFIVPRLFRTQNYEVIDINLQSCDVEKLTQVTLNAYNLAIANKTDLACTGVHLYAKKAFCCYLPLDIPRLNLMMAIISTVSFVLTAICVRDIPPTPPAPSGSQATRISLFSSLRHMFTNQRFVKLAISDFLVSGPPLVVVSTISRSFPAQVAHLSNISSIIGIGVAIPTTMLVGHLLDRVKAYWTFTMAGYGSGTIFWALCSICYASSTHISSYIFVGAVSLALSTYIVWQTAVFETKIEYVFKADTPLEGVIMATDRVVLNLSSLIFLAAIPPERVGGADRMFYIGAAIMIVGCVPTAIIRDRYRYRRLEYDREHGNSDMTESSRNGEESER